MSRRSAGPIRFATFAAALVVAAALLLPGLAAMLPAPPSGLGRGISPPAAGPTVALRPTTLSHVIVVVEENHDLNWTLTDPTFSSLYRHNAHATHAYATCHPSAPNYLALTSAAKLQCGSDGVSSYSTSNLASDAAAHGLSWQGLFESMPSACDRSDHYPYIAHHNPWVYYANLRTGCASHDLPFFTSNGSSRLKTELAGGTLPALTFVAPNMLHDAHDGSLAAASGWLTANVLGPVHNATLYALTTVVLVVFDEGYAKGCGCSESGGYSAGGVTVSGGPIYLVAVSALSPVTQLVSASVTDFNVVTTLEWLLALPPLGHHDTSAFPALKGLFT